MSESERTAESSPRARGASRRLVEGLGADLRLAWRRLRAEPAFATVAVLTLALGVGATTAIFGLIDAVLLAPLAVDRPAELVRLGDEVNCCVSTSVPRDFGLFSNALYDDLRTHTPEIGQLAAFQAGPGQHTLRREGEAAAARPLRGELVSGNYFALLGIRAAAGRVLAPADDTAGAPPVAVLSYRAWQVHFALDPAIVGATVRIDTQPFVVAGIAPPGFFGDTLRADPPDLWMPLASELILDPRNALLRRPEQNWLYLMGRLRPGASRTALEAKLTVELRRWLATVPGRSANAVADIAKARIVLSPGGAGVRRLQDRYSSGLKLLLGAANLVLLIACANVANLLLARGARQRGQTAVRLALGAARGRLLRQSLTEGLVLALAGAAAGVLVAVAATRAILALAFSGALYVPISPWPPLPALGFAVLLALATGVVFGLVPAWLASRADPAEALRAARQSAADASLLPQRVLVVLQTALSVVLLAGAGLLTRSLQNLERQDFGFATEGRIVVQVNPRLAGYTAPRLPGLHHELLARLGALPGVRSAGLALYSPLLDNWDDYVFVAGRAFNPKEDDASFDRVSPGFLETMGQTLLRGRLISDQDSATSRTVAVVNQTFAKRFFGAADPIGRTFGIADPGTTGTYQVVGVVSDAKYYFSEERTRPMYFTALPQQVAYTDPAHRSAEERTLFFGAIALRAAGDPRRLEPAVLRALAEVDPNLTAIRLLTLDDAVTQTFNRQRLLARLTQLFGVLALALAAVGLYGVTAYHVTRRTGEIGIRMVLGARRGDVVAMVLRRALAQVALGVAIGIPAALAGGRLLVHELHGVRAWDPAILGLAALTLAIATLVAGFIPARRAASLDPAVAVRSQ